MKEMVFKKKLSIPTSMSAELTILVKGLLNLDPHSRFSINDIRSNPWYINSSILPHLARDTGTEPTNMASLMADPIEIPLASGIINEERSKIAEATITSPKASTTTTLSTPTNTKLLKKRSPTSASYRELASTEVIDEEVNGDGRSSPSGATRSIAKSKRASLTQAPTSPLRRKDMHCYMFIY